MTKTATFRVYFADNGSTKLKRAHVEATSPAAAAAMVARPGRRLLKRGVFQLNEVGAIVG